MPPRNDTTVGQGSARGRGERAATGDHVVHFGDDPGIEVVCFNGLQRPIARRSVWQQVTQLLRPRPRESDRLRSLRMLLPRGSASAPP